MLVSDQAREGDEEGQDPAEVGHRHGRGDGGGDEQEAGGAWRVARVSGRGCPSPSLTVCLKMCALLLNLVFA